jgi:hypothetical protein
VKRGLPPIRAQFRGRVLLLLSGMPASAPHRGNCNVTSSQKTSVTAGATAGTRQSRVIKTGDTIISARVLSA